MVLLCTTEVTPKIPNSPTVRLVSVTHPSTAKQESYQVQTREIRYTRNPAFEKLERVKDIRFCAFHALAVSCTLNNKWFGFHHQTSEETFKFWFCLVISAPETGPMILNHQTIEEKCINSHYPIHITERHYFEVLTQVNYTSTASSRWGVRCHHRERIQELLVLVQHEPENNG
jgi:hypothetical protein